MTDSVLETKSIRQSSLRRKNPLAYLGGYEKFQKFVYFLIKRRLKDMSRREIDFAYAHICGRDFEKQEGYDFRVLEERQMPITSRAIAMLSVPLCLGRMNEAGMCMGVYALSGFKIPEEQKGLWGDKAREKFKRDGFEKFYAWDKAMELNDDLCEIELRKVPREKRFFGILERVRRAVYRK